MIESINLVRNIGKFDSVTAGSQIPLEKLTVVYAENGRGKTTLTTILQSLSTANPDPVMERQRLGSTHTPHVVLTHSGNQVVFQNASWSTHLPQISVFNDSFVSQNVCAGLKIESEHRQNLHELILGAQGVALNNALQGHITQIEAHNRTLVDKAAAVPVSIRGQLSVDAFCVLPSNENTDGDIRATEQAIAAAKSAAAIRKRQGFESVSLPSFDIVAINSILEQSLPSLQAQAAAHVQAHIATMGKEGENWVSSGMQIINTRASEESLDSCPFCAQNLITSPIIEHYQAYFSEAYVSLKNTILKIGKATSETHKDSKCTAFEQSVRVLVQTREFWKSFINVPAIEINTEEIVSAWNAARDSVLSILRSKMSMPLEKLTLSQDSLKSISTYNEHRGKIRELSEAIHAYNTQIEIVKEQATTANLVSLDKQLDNLKAVKARYSSSICLICDEYVREQAAKKDAERQRDQARSDLAQYRQTVFPAYETAVNLYLQRFNAGYRLGSVSYANHRRGSSCNYAVLINENSVSITAENGPSFRNTLSAGDRNTLALAFFFASLEQDSQRSQKVVVIDDPMTSLDAHRTLATVQQIKQVLEHVEQVIVLSHSKSFLCQLWESVPGRVPRCAIKVSRDGTGSTFQNWDVSQDCITEHDRNYSLVIDYMRASDSLKERAVAAALRSMLESFMRVAYPASFPPGRLLGPFIRACTPKVNTPEQVLNAPDIAELQSLLEYVNKFHHDSNPAWQTEEINDQELYDFCLRTVSFIQPSRPVPQTSL